jgi:hypothetical protein
MKDLYEFWPTRKKETATKKRYAAQLIDGVVDAIVRAHAGARSARLEAGSARQTTPISFNRRFLLRDGSVRTWMKLDNPGVVRAAGPIDPEIALLLVRPAKGDSPLALVSNFALHLDTVGGVLWSADYPYYIEQAVRKSLGKPAVSVFANGCCGDINHVDPSRKSVNRTDFIGEALGKTITGSLGSLRRVERPVLRVRRATVAVPLQKVTAEQVARARPLLLEARAGKQVAFEDHVRAYKAIILDQLRNRRPHARAVDFIRWGLSHTWAGVGDRLPVEVQVIALGSDVAIVCLPGEVFVELGLAIKHASPFRTTLIVELSNCEETLYIPTRTAYAGGGYEVINSALKPGSGEMLAEAAVRLLREVAAENVRRSKR